VASPFPARRVNVRGVSIVAAKTAWPSSEDTEVAVRAAGEREIEFTLVTGGKAAARERENGRGRARRGGAPRPRGRRRPRGRGRREAGVGRRTPWKICAVAAAEAVVASAATAELSNENSFATTLRGGSTAPPRVEERSSSWTRLTAFVRSSVQPFATRRETVTCRAGPRKSAAARPRARAA